MKGPLLVATLVLGGVANADGSVGVVVTGDAQVQASIAAGINAWLQQHGKRVEATPLSADAVNRLTDCFVLADLACAQKIVDGAASDAVVFTRVESAPGGDFRVATTWLAKGHGAVAKQSQCKKCNADTLRITTDAMLFALADEADKAPVTAPPPVIAAAEPAAPAPVATTASVEVPARGPTGLALGVELGDPVSATVAYFAGAFSIGGAIGSGTYTGPGLEAHVDVQLVVARLSAHAPVRVGIGGRYYNDHYQPMSIDEVPDTHLGVRASASLAYETASWQIYVEAAPGIDVFRSPSCTLADGPNSICPHAQSSPAFLQLDVGLRWFLSH
jgi:hypothetical protein